jgi:beta-1,4-N-acetylglucosaminyltransferase
MRILLVCSPGGHLSQMERLMSAFDGHRLALLTYHSPRDPKPLAGVDRTYLVPYVGTNPIAMLRATPTFVKAFYRERPHALVSTGSEIAIVPFLLARILGIRALYIESLSRVHTRSATGRIVYFLADRFFVQWEGLADVYGPKAEYRGRVV